LQDYRNKLALYDPLAYVPNISGRVVISFATHDIMIPSCRGRELLDAFTIESGRRSDLQVTPHIYHYCDHISGAVLFAWNFEKMVGALLH